MWNHLTWQHLGEENQQQQPSTTSPTLNLIKWLSHSGGFPTPELVVPSSSYISTEKQTKLRNNELLCSSLRRLVDNESTYLLTVILPIYIYVFTDFTAVLRLKNPARQPLNDVPENGLTTGLATTFLSCGSAPGKRPTYPNGSSAGNWSDVTEKPTKHLPKKVGMSTCQRKTC